MIFKLFLAIVFSLIPFSQCQSCQTSVLDMVLAIDASGSIGSTYYEMAKTAVEKMIDNLNIGPNKVKVGIVNYSSSAILVKSLINTDQDKATLKAAVRNLPYLDSTTATGDALAMANKVFFANPRDFTPRVTVVFTDGYSNTGSDVYSEADLLKKQNVEIFTVGIGSDIDHNELDQIASIPASKYKKLISNYNELYAAINDITTTACSTPAFINITAKVVVQAEKNEIRNFQVDVTTLSKSALFEIEVTINKGSCIADIDWLFKEKSEQSYAKKDPIEKINSDGRTTIAYYEFLPANALRLYVKIKCIDVLNNYELKIDTF